MYITLFRAAAATTTCVSSTLLCLFSPLALSVLADSCSLSLSLLPMVFFLLNRCAQCALVGYTERSSSIPILRSLRWKRDSLTGHWELVERAVTTAEPHFHLVICNAVLWYSFICAAPILEISSEAAFQQYYVVLEWRHPKMILTRPLINARVPAADPKCRYFSIRGRVLPSGNVFLAKCRQYYPSDVSPALQWIGRLLLERKLIPTRVAVQSFHAVRARGYTRGSTEKLMKLIFLLFIACFSWLL